ncbi:hypothetical protein G7Y31_03090 [Corynebacterium lizhenjunii]|uniref:Uncharacterized protein n=1 Tax=Corynebacterium lizhenjunii TaxID=2709394 RepID=A0A7T0KGA1_9CORY|nr:hypothetical protein [Corynebacterium lizhenjunii]QPK79705.1 hypothetical protein G7Y31_03090 [Corynebacterium lizhenjunii]
MFSLRSSLTIGTSFGALFCLYGCIDLSGWDEMAHLSSAGDAAISLSEDGTIVMHVIACKAPLERIKVFTRGDYPEAPYKEEFIRLDSPQYGYIEVPLAYPTNNDPDVINTIMNEPDRMFWAYPYAYHDGTEKYPPHFPELDGVTLHMLESYPRGTVLYQTINLEQTREEERAGTNSLRLVPTTVENFKHIPSHHREPDCVAN